MAYLNTLFNTNFLEYASYVIKDRAIPHIDDGLKPVQRRILHSLLEMDDGKYHKVANVVGHCMKYHPHGDASINSALVVLANKELLIDKQGNFGNVLTGDEASAARYIECRITPFAKEILHNPEITRYEDSYDGRNREPVVFPAKIPLVLILGAEGIAVGMSTKILPHNLIEVMGAMRAALQGKKFEIFPDFVSGGSLDISDYQDGQGKVLVRAKLDTSDPKRIVIREIPFGTTTESLIASIENAARKNKIKIQNISDYTTENVEIEIKLARGVYAQEVVDSLFAYTECETSIAVNLLVIQEKNPVSMTVTEVIQYHSGRLVEILRQELELERRQLNDRLHARTLERIFIEERIYKQIEEMETQETVSQAVIDGFVPFADQIQREVTAEDVERLLKIPIRRISLYDINRAREEMAQIRARLKEISHHLKHIVDYAIGFVDHIIESQGKNFPRRTEITSFQKVDVREVAQRNLTLRYDAQTGYLGYEVSSGKPLFDVSQYDRILVIRGNGTYSVIDVPDKIFVDRGMLSCGLAEKDILSEKVFNVLYRQEKTNFAYLKRCKIEQFIIEKVYPLVPDDARALAVTTKQDVAALVKYKKKPRLQVTEETFPVENFLIKGVKASGVRLASKEITAGRFVPYDSGGKRRGGHSNESTDADYGDGDAVAEIDGAPAERERSSSTGRSAKDSVLPERGGRNTAPASKSRGGSGPADTGRRNGAGSRKSGAASGSAAKSGAKSKPKPPPKSTTRAGKKSRSGSRSRDGSKGASSETAKDRAKGKAKDNPKEKSKGKPAPARKKPPKSGSSKSRSSDSSASGSSGKKSSGGRGKKK